MFKFTKNEIEDAIEFINEHKGLYYERFIDCIKNQDIRDLTEEENARSDKFYSEHKNCCVKKLHKPFYSSTGGGFEYIIDWTPIGFIYTCRCNSCGESVDVTDYNILKNNYNNITDETLINISYDSLLAIKPYSLIICGTGLGPCITIIDNYTHDSKDITDSDSW